MPTELIQRAKQHGDRIAFRTPNQEWTYAKLESRSAEVAGGLLGGEADLAEARVGYLVPAGFEYTAIQWGIWRAGGVAVPLSMSATEPELEYALSDSGATKVVVAPELRERVQPIAERLGLQLLVSDQIDGSSSPDLPTIDASRRAMILFTSGTTSRPKGVVSTHANIRAQITTLVDAWQWQPDDSIPVFLPLHHIHGIINKMSCALWVGAVIEPFPRFDLKTIFDRVSKRAYSVFMAVPTIYVKMIQALDGLERRDRDPILDGFRGMRLMISGSAALPATVHNKWTELTGQRLLERYGMTEIGMGLSNPYNAERRAGMVGQPLPGVELRLKAEDGSIVETEAQAGEIQIKGPCVFLEYFNRPEATIESFDDSWFRTGDMAVLEHGYYRIMGRLSVDIIKSGGYKLSALEIESTLLEHPAIKECAVVGIPDDTWGEVVAVAAVLADGMSLTVDELRDWSRERLSKYKLPTRLKTAEQLPRNAMGKVQKPQVVKLF